MTKFEPEVAYRILIAKYDRLRFDAILAYRDLVEIEYRGELNPYGRLWRCREINGLTETADAMWPVLEYLRTRIEEEQHDAV